MAERVDLDGLAAVIAARAAALLNGARLIVAIAGAPGSGKSTAAERLAEKLNAGHPGLAAVMPMDGYHYDDLHLVPAGLRPRKGAPDTFDVGGLRSTLSRLRANDEAFVAIPVFDRDIEIARAGARMIPRDVPVLIVEGNYLLLNRAPWDSLRPLLDLTVMIPVPEDVLRARLRERWVGYNLTPEQIDWKLDGNDLPNGRVVADESVAPDYLLEG